ncbi:MAG TPA: iron dicitrate transport regulator FecR [Microscillaceae bacterium]|nr:iron dicitrate transport regulator FecR [Microscillaceae bacterium]
MKSNDPHKKLTPQQEQEFFSKLEVPYQRSKSEVWEKLSSVMDDTSSAEKKPAAKVISLRRKNVYVSLAASFLLLLGVGMFARFYTKTIEVNAGQFTSHTLPDRSQVHLNAETKIAYAPYWWRFSRKVSLKGEAFFEVAKGKKFQVTSDKGVTEVLGTKFNIRARGTSYEVYCTEGKVRVSNRTTSQVVLLPGQLAKLNNKQLEKSAKEVKQDAILSWRLKKFIYNTTPLAKVLRDVERHYNVKIQIALTDLDVYNYTGIFSRSVSVEEALKVICLSLGLNLEHTKSRLFTIKK